MGVKRECIQEQVRQPVTGKMVLLQAGALSEHQPLRVDPARCGLAPFDCQTVDDGARGRVCWPCGVVGARSELALHALQFALLLR